MLSFTTPAELKAAPDAVRFFALAILLGLRDKASRVEVRFGDGDALLYHRSEGRDWELAPVSEELFPELKPALRKLARLVTPERPEFTVTAGVVGARVEPQQIGWLTFELEQRLIDLAVRIDPREPYGFIQLDIEYPDEADLSGLAGQALEEYYALDADEPSNLFDAGEGGEG